MSNASDLLLIDDYSDYLVMQRRLSEATQSVYTHEVALFLASGVDYEHVGTTHIESYLVEQVQLRRLSERSVAKMVSALRSVFSFLQLSKIREDNPVLMIKRGRQQQNLPQVASIAQVDELLDSIDTADALGFRDRTLFELIYSCGLRISEACDLEVSDYQRTSIRVIGKRHKIRIIPVGEVARSWVDAYLKDVRQHLIGMRGSTKALFVGRRGRKLTRASHLQTIHRLLRCNRARCKGAYPPSESFATISSKAVPIEGDAGTSRTQRYQTTQMYTHVDTEAVQQAYEQFHADVEDGHQR